MKFTSTLTAVAMLFFSAGVIAAPLPDKREELMDYGIYKREADSEKGEELLDYSIYRREADSEKGEELLDYSIYRRESGEKPEELLDYSIYKV